MKSKRSLMVVLVGLAMLAAPIAAAAYDGNNYAHNNARNNSRPAHVSRSTDAPARSFAPARNVRPDDVTRRDFHNNVAAAHRDWREDHNAWNRGWGNFDEYRNYGNPGYYRAPGYPVAGPYYGAPGYAVAGPCGQAQKMMSIYSHDRNTGHPAAAADVLARNQSLLRSCGLGSPYGGAPLGAFGGVPVYNNYGGYGQPYGATSTLAPLIQQFVR